MTKKVIYILDKAIMQNRSSHMLIMGDFNYPDIDYVNSPVMAGESDPASLFFDKKQNLCLL